MAVKKNNQKKTPVAKTEPEKAQRILKKISNQEKKQKEKEYQSQIKDVLSGFAVTSVKPKEDRPEEKPVQPKIVAPVKASAIPFNEELRKIRQSILEFLGHEPEATKTKFVFQKPPVEKKMKPETKTEEFKAEKKAIPLVPKFKVAKLPDQEEPVHQDNLRLEKLAQKAFVPKETVGDKFSRKPLLRSLILLLIFLVIIFSLGIYLGGWHSTLSAGLAKVIPYPAVYVDGGLVRASVFFEDVEALGRYLKRAGVTVAPDQVKRQVMASLIEKEVVKKIAKGKGLEVSEAEIAELKNQLASEAGVEELVGELYGWSLDKYAERVLMPLLLAQKVEVDFYDSDLMKSLKEEMESYVEELTEEPSKFEEIASKVNDDSTKFVEGDLGWFSLGDMVPEFEYALLEMEAGQTSGVVETRFGLHLIKLEEKLVNEDGQATFHARHIFRKTLSFSDFLEGEIKKASVVTLIRL